MLQQIVKRSFQKLSHHPKLRVFLIVCAVTVIFIVTMNIFGSKNKPPVFNSAVEAASGQGPAKPAVASESAEYNTLAKAQQAKDLERAQKTGGTIFENPTLPASTSTTQAPPSNTNNQKKSSDAPFVVSPTGVRDNDENPDLSKQVQDLQQQLDATRQQQQQTQMQAQVGAIMTSMQNSLQSASASWGLPTLQTQTGTPGNTGSGGGGGGQPQPPVAIKAGSILFGVIETSLDSDQPGTPVLATIVSGPYQGSRLMGSFVVSNNALVVQFNLMSIASLPSTFSVNAYAIDAKTANNSVATSVNNHYLLRYGLLFASAFLQGFGEAFSNTTYTCPPDTPSCTVINTGTTTTQNPTVTTTHAMYQGLGQIGTNVGQVAAAQFNTPPTVKVAQGTGIGVLFMSDVRIPTE